MARGRLISKSLGSSRKFHALLGAGGKLGEFCQVLFPLIVANTDDWGRMPGDAFTVKHVVLPSSPRLERDFDAALEVMRTVGIITRYVVDGTVYLQVTDFDAHQVNLHKRTKPHIPEPPKVSGSFQNPPDLPSELNLTESNSTEENRTEPRVVRSRLADALFDRFWVAYPRKEAKDRARKAWDARRPDEALLVAILRAIEAKRDTHAWTKERGKYVPLPATWLNDGRWQDAVDVDVGAPRSETAIHNEAVISEWLMTQHEEPEREH